MDTFIDRCLMGEWVGGCSSLWRAGGLVYIWIYGLSRWMGGENMIVSR